MKNIVTLLIIVLTFTSILFSQKAMIDKFLIITDGAGGTQTINFGIDTAATDGIDTILGEAPFPPLPPTGIFDVRFNLSSSTDASLKDYRYGTIPFTGEKIHEIQFQVGTGTKIKIDWDLPIDSSIIGRLQDVVLGTIIDVPMIGIGSYTLTDPAVFNKLKMTITYIDALPDDYPNTVEVENFLKEFSLYQNYPNPFNPSTSISYSLPSNSFVRLNIYNILGQEITTLINEEQLPGHYEVNFIASSLPSGVYIYKMQAGDFVQTRKLILQK